VNLPSFLWLWKIAAWSMGFAIAAYLLLAVSGGWMFSARQAEQPRPSWLRPAHIATGITMVALVLLLLAIGLVGTWGHFGSLGHSAHLPVGLAVVDLVFLSAWSAVQIRQGRSWARGLHIGTNLVLLIAFAAVSLTGWTVVQKYLP
jgi:phosphatidylglycerophosphate synthase